MFGLEKKKLTVKPTLFVVNIAGEDYQFAALSMRDMEKFVADEATAKNEPEKLKAVWRSFVAASLNRGGTETAVDDLVDLDSPVFNALLKNIMVAHGMKLEAKLGEASPR
jgi:hypothetical protein